MTVKFDVTNEKLDGKLISERCKRCHGRMVLELDSAAGYYKSCVNCGYLEYLHRRVLKQNRHYK